QAVLAWNDVLHDTLVRVVGAGAASAGNLLLPVLPPRRVGPADGQAERGAFLRIVHALQARRVLAAPRPPRVVEALVREAVRATAAHPRVGTLRPVDVVPEEVSDARVRALFLAVVHQPLQDAGGDDPAAPHDDRAAAAQQLLVHVLVGLVGIDDSA